MWLCRIPVTGQPGGIYDHSSCLSVALIPRSLLALCWILPAAFATLLARGHETDLSGVYQGHAPASDAARRVFTLNLASDGTAMLTTQYIGKNNATMHGRWTQSGRQIVLTFDSMGPNGASPADHLSSSRPRTEPGSLGSQRVGTCRTAHPSPFPCRARRRLTHGCVL